MGGWLADWLWKVPVTCHLPAPNTLQTTTPAHLLALTTPSPHAILSSLQAMNRSLANVILGGYGMSAKGPAAKVEGTATEIDIPGTAEAITNGGCCFLPLSFPVISAEAAAPCSVGIKTPSLSSCVTLPACPAPPLSALCSQEGADCAWLWPGGGQRTVRGR